MPVGYKRSLATKALWAVSAWFVVLMTATVTFSYLQQFWELSAERVESLTKYVRERVQREREQFALARDDHQILRERIMEELAAMDGRDEGDAFDALVKRYPDGAWRNADPHFDGRRSPAVYANRDVTFTPDMRRRMLAFYRATAQLGPAWRDRFRNTYAIGPENFAALFWPDFPTYFVDMGGDFNITAEEFFWAADRAHDPERRTVSTGLYVDPGTKGAMVSLLTPVDDAAGRHIAVLGHDIPLDQLIHRTINESMSGTYNMIFRSDGRLIAHPTKMEQIAKRTGKLTIQDAGDPELLSIYRTVRERAPGSVVLEPKGLDVFLAVERIDEPDWDFVIVYPKSLIRRTALRPAMVIAGIGLITLLLALVVLYFLLRKRIADPLRAFIASTQKIREGRLDVYLPSDSDDELGALARVYNAMADELRTRDAEIRRYTGELESLVEERTSALAQQRVQAESAARLASLGEMAAGIAHEINNPLAIIQGSAEALLHHWELGSVEGREAAIRGAAERIVRTAERIATVVRGLRTFARDGAEDPPTEVAVPRLIDDALDVCSMRFKGRGLELRRAGESPGLMVTCRSVQIVQVLLNLLNNAFDAVKAEKAPWIRISVVDRGATVEIRVEDSGPGIPGWVAQKIMLPFFTTKDVGAGTGLGLSISMGIVSGHGGTLRLDREAAHTCFVVSLPKALA